MTDGSAGDAAATGLGRRRSGGRPDGAAPGTPAPAGADPAATGLGFRRTGRPPSADSVTTVHRLRDRGAASSDSVTSMIRPHDAGSIAADGTALGQRRPAPPPSGPFPAADGTALGQRRAAPPPSGPFPAADGTALGQRRPAPPPSGPFPAAGATGPGARAPIGPAPTPEGLTRFGPGVPSGPPPVAPGWQQPAPSPPSPGRPTRRRRSVVAALLVLAAVAAVLAYLFLRPQAPVGIRGVTVAAQPPEAGCGATVVLVGTVATDGTAGRFTYRWERSDGQVGEVLTQSVGSGTTSSDVRLQWTVSGQGSFQGTATLRVLDGAAVSPDAAVGDGTFTYAC